MYTSLSVPGPHKIRRRLQHTATHCNTLQHTALQHTATHWSLIRIRFAEDSPFIFYVRFLSLLR